MRGKTLVVFLTLLGILVWLCPTFVAAQTGAATGMISGTVTDHSGAPVESAKVAITNAATNQVVSLLTNRAGVYTSGAVAAGNYTVRVLVTAFGSVAQTVNVQAGKTSTANINLALGQEQPVVYGVMTRNQAGNLPVSGRNFLDLAQFEPGAQIEDGQVLDSVKAGFQSISLTGRSGRTTRIELDHVDISDERVGTTTTNVPLSAIQDFHLSQSNLDMSAELTSTGIVNITTKSGANPLHGQAFGTFRDSSFASRLPGLPGPFQRTQYGGAVGGAIIKDKAFFFVDGEHTIQHTNVPVLVAAPFSQYSGSFNDPFRESDLLGRLDYAWNNNARAFYRFSYSSNSLGANSGLGYSLYDNVDVARDHALGLDFTAHGITHSLRFSYLRFQNHTADITTGSSLPFANLHAEIFMGSSGLVAGPNPFAPQSTAQSDEQVKYDGSKIAGAHLLRFGVGFNRLMVGGLQSFYQNGPQILANTSTSEMNAAAGGPFPGGASNPLNYPADSIVLSNGLGYITRQSALGYAAGGLGPDNRLLLYLGDTWRARPNFALTWAARYNRDTNRTDSQYPGILQFNSLSTGLGNPVRQPNNEFGPQFGFVWDPGSNGLTSIRAGIGVFWENALWNDLMLDATRRQRTGSFLQFASPCAGAGQPNLLPSAGGPIVPSATVCGTSRVPLIGNVLPAILALQQQWAAASPQNFSGSNPAFAGQYLGDCSGGTNCFFAPGAAMFDPNYRTPRSVQMNIGMQRQVREGTVLSLDYVRNVETHYLIGVDKNFAGNIRFFNLTGAQLAIANTIANCGGGASTVVQTYSRPCPRDPRNGTDDLGTYIPRIATIGDYAANGLGSSTDMGGKSCLAKLGYNCAFGGFNPVAPPLNFLSPVGRSLYSGVQMRLVQNVKSPFRGARSMNLQLGYSLSRFDNTGGAALPDHPVTASNGDQDLPISALDNADVNRYFGPSIFDRTHQVSFGAVVDIRGNVQWAMIGHFASPLSTRLTVPSTATSGQIFQTDFTGDGTTQDPIPGNHSASYDRGGIDASTINNVISRYNNSVAGKPTPAGNVLVGASLMTSADLAALGGVAPVLAAAPNDPSNLSWLRTYDTSLAWSYSFRERVTIKPSVSIYNVFNFANHDLPGNMLSGLMNGAPGSVNGTDYNSHFVNRVGVGSGVYTLGAPRQIEFSLKVNF